MPKLIDDVRKAWRMISMQCMGAAAALQSTWLNLPDDLKAHVPPGLVTKATIALVVLGMIGRLIKQGDSNG